MRRPVGVKGILDAKRAFGSFSLTKFLLPPSSRCRHASIRTLEERIISLGACWAFSFQPVLPSVWRPLVSLKSERGPGDRRSHRNSALAFDCSLPGTILTWFCLVVFTRLPRLSCDCCCAMARTPLRSPTGDAATPPAFSRSQRWLDSSRSSLHARPVSVPSV